MENKWIKNCPKCGRGQLYTSKYTLKNAILKNKWCNKCRQSEKRIVVPEGGWTKNCPICGSLQIYCCKAVLETSIRKNTLCNKCRSRTNRKYKTDVLERRCPNCSKILEYQSYLVYKRAVNKKGMCNKCAAKKSAKYIDRSFQRKNEYIGKMSKSLKNAWKVSKNYRSEHHLEKLRELKLNQIKKLGTLNNYSRKACKFINKLNKERGWNLQHALNGGEHIVSGYSLDGYDKERNIVFEYDESRHNSPSKKPFDLIRQKRIIDKINPLMFVRYNERFNTLIDVISGRKFL